jgi:VacB/RNase II family 3'-5' exoribonuclease
MDIDVRHPLSVLQPIARRAMMARGLSPEIPPAALAELDAIAGPAPADATTRDLRHLLWCSIDNDESRDLDQLTVAEELPGDEVKLMVAIADVAACVGKDSHLDEHARRNTTSVYTVAQLFPMLPERLSTDLTSMNFAQDRRAVVVEMTFDADGSLQQSDLSAALVRNHARLNYGSVAAWLDGFAPLPVEAAGVPGLAENLQLQDRIAQELRARRHVRGALALETVRARPVFSGEALQNFAAERTNRAQQLIQDLMIAANGATARFLSDNNIPSIRRIIRAPQRWDRIVQIAATHEVTLPGEPDPKALQQFLIQARADDPARFPELSLSIMKLMGGGEYAVEIPGTTPVGHFGLAEKDYTHSTAPNRRYPDLITQRLLKAALAGRASPYTNDALAALAQHCTVQEDAAKKVERQVAKSAAAMLLQSRIGAHFDAIVTGASPKGTWVRITDPVVEGKLVSGFDGREVGDRLRVRLVHTDVERGLIDFKSAG